MIKITMSNGTASKITTSKVNTINWTISKVITTELWVTELRLKLLQIMELRIKLLQVTTRNGTTRKVTESNGKTRKVTASYGTTRKTTSNGTTSKTTSNGASKTQFLVWFRYLIISDLFRCEIKSYLEFNLYLVENHLVADLETEDSEEQPLYPRIPGREKYTDNNTTKLSFLQGSHIFKY